MRALRLAAVAALLATPAVSATSAHATCADPVRVVCAAVCRVDHPAVKNLCAVT